MELVLMIAYVVVAYWATNKVYWSKRAYVYTNTGKFYINRIIICLIAGFITIPIAIIQTLISKN